MKRIMLLGASGSIGQQTIDVIGHHLDQFQLVGFSVGRRVESALAILKDYNVEIVCVQKAEDVTRIKDVYPNQHVVWGDDGLIECAAYSDYDVLVNALVGYVGLKPTVKALECDKDIALANKETLVVGGQIVMDLAKKHEKKVIPIDSEHSAIFQCLQGVNRKDVTKLWITASGGAFRDLSHDEVLNKKAVDALKHPNWVMGAKITIDSATMVNKGFEVLEASWLFDMPLDQIQAIMHPQSIVHSLIECNDGAILAQLGSADMRLPIQYALTYPDRYEIPGHEAFTLDQVFSLDFKPIDLNRFPLFALCIECGKKGNIYPCVFNAANEVANLAYREDKITYEQLEHIITQVCSKVTPSNCVTLDTLAQANDWAVALANSMIKEIEQ